MIKRLSALSACIQITVLLSSSAYALDYRLQQRKGTAQWECAALSDILDNGKFEIFFRLGLKNLQDVYSAAIGGKMSAKDYDHFSWIIRDHKKGISPDFLLGAEWVQRRNSIREIMPVRDSKTQTLEQWRGDRLYRADEEFRKRNCDLLQSN
ncbi:hypothetical protein [Pseudovibrio sp. FO-BEG1]|uniref:hypothetical protein n=1 Tax=Pseudovibrio sp. (strain FO-BEG1) TaxID=911045 RepID=UPI0005A01529|nr:hypothetical protein [Pseudovibrio sp. FO-BEG1]